MGALFIGLPAFFVEAISIIKPLKFLRIYTRKTAAVILLAGFVVLLAGVILCPRSEEVQASAATRAYWPAAPRLAMRTATVQRVIDGDTVVLAGGERVRFIGVNAPEIQDDDPFAREATTFVRGLIGGRKITLEYYPMHRLDIHGRTLAYVWIDVGNVRKMLNAMLLREGLAEIMTIRPQTSYVVYFTVIQNAARQRQVGIWAPWLH